MKFSFAASLLVFALSGTTAQAIIIELDYTYDTNDFFDQPGSKEALRAVADFYEERINDNLLRIDQSEFSDAEWSATFFSPDTGVSLSVPNLIVPEDTIIVFVGGRDIGALGSGGPGGLNYKGIPAWEERLLERGQSRAGELPPTDFSLWGGSIVFDLVLGSGSSWNFSVDSPVSPASEFDFVSTALHEFGHLLGIGTSEAWEAHTDAGDLFNGPQSVASFGEPVPVQVEGQNGRHGHWQDDDGCAFPLGYTPGNPLNVLSLSYGSFGSEHAVPQIARMDPRSCGVSNRTAMLVMTDLDMAALRDIGWEVQMPQTLEVLSLNPTDASFEWPSSTGETYFLQRSTDLVAGWSDLSPLTAGDGSILSFADPSPPAAQAFYRLSDTSTLASSSSSVSRLSASNSSEPSVASSNRSADTPVTWVSVPPRLVDGCGVCSH